MQKSIEALEKELAQVKAGIDSGKGNFMTLMDR